MKTRKPFCQAVTAVAALTALSLTACAPDEAEFTEGEPTESPEAAAEADPTEEPTETPAPTEEDDGAGEQDVLYAEVDAPVTFEECEAAEEEGAAVTWLDDVVIEEEEVAQAIPSRTVTVEGEEIDIPGAPAIVVPERVGQAGCLIEYHAPGGCLPAVEISGSYVPGYSVPERELPAVELPDGEELERVVQEADNREAEQAEGAYAEEVCQVEEGEELEAGQHVRTVNRTTINRSTLNQSTLNQSTHNRSTINAEGWSVAGDSMLGYSVEGTSVMGVSIMGDSLMGYTVEGTEGTERSGEDTVSYITEGDVLFDTGEYDLRSDAESELQAIVEDIAELEDQDFTIEVEGHTDDEPVTSDDRSFSENQELSELRAESVLGWLVENTDVHSEDITAEGLGEDYPRADNSTEEGREQNRRVVITVIPEGAEDQEPDYELED